MHIKGASIRRVVAASLILKEEMPFKKSDRFLNSLSSAVHKRKSWYDLLLCSMC